MRDRTITVTEWMADLIKWAEGKGEEELRKMVRGYLAEIKEQNEVSKESHVDEGFKWDDALEPNDGNDQWKHGGDCNLCRKEGYCGRKCRAQKLLTKITTPFLYQQYLTENPEAAAKNPKAFPTEQIMQEAGLI